MPEPVELRSPNGVYVVFQEPNALGRLFRVLPRWMIVVDDNVLVEGDGAEEFLFGAWACVEKLDALGRGHQAGDLRNMLLQYAEMNPEESNG